MSEIKKPGFSYTCSGSAGGVALPIMAFAQVSSCSVSIPVEIKVTGSRIPADVPYRLVLKAVTPEARCPSLKN